MAHEIEFNAQKGTYSSFSRKEIPWHKLGQIVEDAKTSREVLELANLDFNVHKAPNYAKINDQFIQNTDSFSTIRTDTNAILGTVGTRYEILQNTEAFSFFDDIVSTKNVVFETAGVLYNGRKVFISAKLPDVLKLNNQDVVDKYLLLTNDHTGRESAVVTFTSIRVVCNNTLNMALASAANQYRIRHTKSMSDRMNRVAYMMGLKDVYFSEMETHLNRLKSIKMKEKHAKEHVCRLILNETELGLLASSGNLYKVDEISTRKKNQIVDMFNWIEKGVGQDMYRGTGLWLYNGVVGYYNNAKQYTTDENKFENLMGGTSYKVIEKSKQLIEAYD